MNRAERRRAMRANFGVKRARGKKGRRAAVRASIREPETFEHLGRAGFELVRPRIVLPGED